MTKDGLVEIIWLDAVSGEFDREEFESKVKNKTVSDYLVEQTSRGKLIYEDGIVVVLAHNENEDKIEYHIIPAKWIKGRKVYNASG